MAEFDDENIPRQLPEKYRASLDPDDAGAYQRLQENDEKQRELAERFNSPLSRDNPRGAFRAKALITIKEIENAAFFGSAAILERLSDAHATVGNYDKAEEFSQLAGNTERAELYSKYWDAVWLPDDEWCEHDVQHKYIKEYVWSVKENREMPMLACNVCHTWNVLDAPQHLVTRESQQSEFAGQTADKTIGEAREWHRRRFGR